MELVYAENNGLRQSDVITTCLGTVGSLLTEKDIRKPVKSAATNTSSMLLCASGDEIEGFVHSINIGTANDGFSHGGVQRNGRMTVKLGGTVAMNGLVVSGANTAYNTASVSSYIGVPLPVVIAGTPTTYKWKVIRFITGTGVVGDYALIERI
jgi:hypothetical protein